jgi:predicted metal-dependent phosphoesterase TrpH
MTGPNLDPPTGVPADREYGCPVDLHVHTSVTDGRQEPFAVLDAAAAAGVQTMTITDHSVVVWSDELCAYAFGVGVRLAVPGMELSTVHEGERHHLLVYGSGCLDEEFARFCARPNERKNDRLLAAARRLDGRFTVPDEQRLRTGELPDGSQLYPHKRMLGQTVLSEVVAAWSGVAPAVVREALTAATDAAPADPAATYLPSVEALSRARALGVVVALAHPLWRPGSRRHLAAHLDTFTRYGLSGMEVASYHHERPGPDPALVGLLDSFGLLRFGGSDYHANGKSRLGRYGLLPGEFDRIGDRVAVRASR